MNCILTFGQAHAHEINGRKFDKDTVARITAADYYDCREIAFDTFGKRWCFIYEEKDFDKEDLHYYKNGIVDLIL